MTDSLHEQPEAPIPTQKAADLPAWFGPVVGLVIITVMIALGGLYLWGSMLTPEDLIDPQPARVNDEPETVRAEADVQITETVSPSTEIDAIAADIESSLIATYETDLQAMDAEVETFEENIAQP